MRMIVFVLPAVVVRMGMTMGFVPVEVFVDEVYANEQVALVKDFNGRSVAVDAVVFA